MPAPSVQDGVLEIGGGRLRGDDILRLYAEGGNGVVKFIDDVILQSNNRVEIAAGKSVEIAAGKKVEIRNHLDVFTPSSGRNYNKAGFGLFNGEFNLHECEFGDRPAFDADPGTHKCEPQSF